MLSDTFLGVLVLEVLVEGEHPEDDHRCKDGDTYHGIEAHEVVALWPTGLSPYIWEFNKTHGGLRTTDDCPVATKVVQ